MKRKQRKWTDEDKRFLRKMWEANVHRNEIARHFEVTGDAVAHMARHLGYKRNPKPIRWGKVKLDFQIITYRHVGLTRRQIAEKLGIRRSHLDSRINIIRRRAERKAGRRMLSERNKSKPKADTRKKRTCLPCGVEFLSTHAGNRICGACRQSAAFQDASSTETFIGIYE